MKTLIQAAVAASLLSATAASAHVTLEKAEAPPKSTYKAVFRVPHGCGQSATTAINVTIPEGVIAAKPMPKAGWKLEITKGAYAKSYKYYSSEVFEGPKQITWSGGMLPDDQYDEFTISVYFSDAISVGTNVFFPVEQTCEKGVNHWTGTAKDGEPAKEGVEPAPSVKITDVQQAAGSAAKDYTVGELVVSNPWARATPNGAKVGGGYVKITNNDHHPDKLIAATFERAGSTSLHEMKMEGDVMKMGEMSGGVEIAPHGTLTLEPGKFHLMLMDLKAALKEGDRIKGSLTFQKAGKLDVEFVVKGMGATN